jgi:hypothetical protein
MSALDAVAAVSSVVHRDNDLQLKHLVPSRLVIPEVLHALKINRSLLHALIRAPELRDPGSLFVITGRGTFSAAMMFAIDLEKQSNAIFVGEPTGASLNHYGDSRKVQLPNSGLTIRVSTLYWQYRFCRFWCKRASTH